MRTIACSLVTLERGVMESVARSSSSETPFRVNYNTPDASADLALRLTTRLRARPDSAVVVVLCIGTDRSTGDSLGPLTGSKISARDPGVHVFGTLDHPVHAVNLADTIREIEGRFSAPFIIAVDACLGQAASIGQITLSEGALRPGAGVHKTLPEVGQVHITGIVNVGGFMEYFVLQNTRLAVVYKMAQTIAEGLHMALLEDSCSSRESVAACRNAGGVRTGWWRIR